jgi:hypothetical protein
MSFTVAVALNARIMPGSLKLYFAFLNCDAAKVGNKNRARFMPSKDKDIFYLKLQWISAKDETERKNLGEKIRQLLSTK